MKQLLLVILFTALTSSVLTSQEIGDPQNLPKELAAARTRLEKTEDTEENKSWHQAIEERIALLEAYALIQANDKKIEDRDIKKEISVVKQSLKEARSRAAPIAPDLSEADDLAAELQKIEDATNIKKTDLDTADNKLSTLKEQAGQARTDLTNCDTLITEAITKLDQLKEEDPISIYKRTNNRFARKHYTEKKTYLDRAIRHATELLPLFEIEAEFAKAIHNRASTELTLGREAATKIRKLRAEIARKRSEAEKLEAQLEADPVEKFIRIQVATIPALQADTSEIKTDVEAKKTFLDEEQTETKRIKGQLESFRQRLSAGGRTSTDSFLTRTLDRTHRNYDRMLSSTLPTTEAELDQTQGELAEVLDKEFNLELPLGDNPLFQDLLKVTPETDRARAEQRFIELRDGDEDEDEKSDGLLKTYKNKSRALETLSTQLNLILVEQREHIQSLQDLDQYLRGQMFWIQSDPPMNWSTIVRAGEQISKLDDPFRKTASWENINSALLSRPLVLLAAILLFGVTFIPGVRRFRRRDEPEDPDLRQLIEQTVYTLVRRAIFPAALLICARILDQAALGVPVSVGLVALLDMAAILLAIRLASITFLCPSGIPVHFKLLVPDVAAQLLRALKFFTAISLLTWPLHALLQTEGFELKALERVIETIWLVAVVLVMVYLIRGRGSLVQKWTRADGITRKAWTFIWPLLALQLVATVVLFVLGFTIGARQLSGNATKTLLAAIILAGLYRVSLRLAAKSTAYMRSKMLEQGEGEAWSEASASTFQFLTRLAAVTILAIAALILQQLWGIGANVRNVLGSLHALELGSEGEIDYLLITYLDVFYSILWVVGGHVIAHNVGRLYELIFVPLVGQGDKGGRYALITLSRYAILLCAWFAALLALQVSFEKLSWLLTATSVGIGFGLQEIVANFISGLILLFERPIRVGDIVTVGTTEGTVDKITIRATVVTNWERQTIIIPNKTFITENLTNWTRNDQVMRRTLQFGVAHGSDVEQVLRVMSEVVVAHPCVLEEPPHRIWFRGIGEFTLNFEVWVFASISDGLRTRSELYTQIYARLEKEGIKIPLPQTETRLIGDAPPHLK